MQPRTCRARPSASALRANNRRDVRNWSLVPKLSSLFSRLRSESRRQMAYHIGLGQARDRLLYRIPRLLLSYSRAGCSISCERVGVERCERFLHPQLHRSDNLVHGARRSVDMLRRDMARWRRIRLPGRLTNEDTKSRSPDPQRPSSWPNYQQILPLCQLQQQPALRVHGPSSRMHSILLNASFKPRRATQYPSHQSELASKPSNLA